MRYLLTGIMTGALLFVFRFLMRTELPLYGVIKKYDLLLLATLLVVFWMLSAWIVDWILENKKSNRVSHILLVVAAAFVLVLPMTKISSEQIGRMENRNLAKFPNLIDQKGFNYEYGKQFESWLNDHFRGRDKALKMYSRIESFLSGKAENVHALEGREGWLFLKENFSIANYQNRRNFTEQELRTIKERLEKNRDYCASFGARYYVLIAPDKNKVYGEFFPSYYDKVNDIGRGEQVYRYLKENSDIKVVYPLDALLEGKQEEQVYYKNDSHWTPAGALIGYRELIKLMAKDDPSLQTWSDQDFDKETIIYKGGDLKKALNLLDRQDEVALLHFKQGQAYTKKQVEIQDTKFTAMSFAGLAQYEITDRSSAEHCVFVFRDSFTRALQPFLSQQFGHVEYLWSREFSKNASAMRERNPDIVIQEVVERVVEDLAN